MENKLSGKIALVTGGSRGIGAAIALRLAKDGADVAISYVSSPDKAGDVVKQIEALGRRAIAIKADQANSNDVDALVKKVGTDFGRIDILINSAGVYNAGTVDSVLDTDAIDRQYAVNVKGVATAVRAAVPFMREGGRIVNIGSVLGQVVPWAGLADYAATKGAVALYGRGWARDLGAKGITVNTVQPGPIDTDMNPADSEGAEAMKAAIPLGRYGKVEEVAAAVAFLASPEASYITGATLNVDGGAIA